MFPKKLRIGDEIRVIAPARSLGFIPKEQNKIAEKRFSELGFKVSFSKNCKKIDAFNSSNISSRIMDLHDAFLDNNVKAIFTVIGGFNSNQLLQHIDYKIIKKNPKIFCGYSDITALENAIFAKTGLVTYSGPHYSTFGMKYGLEYTLDYFKKCLMSNERYEIKPSKEWSDDQWYFNQENRKFIKDTGFEPVVFGEASGTIIGANLCTLNLLQGTKYMPSLKNTIIFIEDDETTTPELVDRNLQSLIHQPDFDKVKGIVVGKFQKKTNMTQELLKKIILTKKELLNIPVITNVNFGHTTPQITFPIGGEAKIISNKNESTIEITEH